MADMKPAQSNLESFLCSVTPSVRSELLPKSCVYDINGGKNECVESFSLGDLWQCYDEWSVYGVGTPVVLSDGEVLTQYFAPYLSAIQIYTNSPAPSSRERLSRIGLDSVLSFSDESESDKLSRSTSSNSSGWEASSDEYPDCSVFSSSSSEKLGQVYKQYFEYASPYTRKPFYGKMVELGCKYPGLMKLKNVELSPASWMAVAWYPIYHIPSHRALRDLSTMFLTYHTLSSCFQDDEFTDIDSGVAKRVSEKGGGRVWLEPFGMTSYRMAGDVWINGAEDYDRLMTLHSAADSWLKQLGSYHHDFNFFVTHSSPFG